MWITAALAMLMACGGKDVNEQEQGWDTGPDCQVGALGCACTSGGGCDGALTCQSDVCVEQPAPCCGEPSPHEENTDFSPGLLPEHASERGSAGAGAVGESTTYGAPIGEVCGVVAYQNGPVVDYSSGLGPWGLKYQCTEYSFRFISKAYGLAESYDPATQGRYGDARFWFDQSNNSVINSLERYPNGSTTPPAPGDILVWNYGTYGHVAVIKEVDLDAGWVVVVEQNNFQGNSFVPIERKPDGRHVGSQSLKGWLRAPGAWEANCAPDPDASCTGIIHDATITNESLLTARADVHCEGGLEKASLVVGEGVTVHSQDASSDSLRLEVQLDLAQTGAQEGIQPLGLWAKEVGGDAVLVASKTISWNRPCDEAPRQVCMGDDVHVLECGASTFVRTCGSGTQCREGVCEAIAPNCMNACSQGETRCDGTATAIDRCEMGADGCPVWRRSEACASGSTCEVSRGVASCECSPNARLRCHNDGNVWSYDSCDVPETPWTTCGADELCVEDNNTARCESNAPITSIQANKTTPSYTAAGPCDTANSRALYTATSVSIDEASATGKLAFKKCNGTTHSSSRRYWVVVGHAYPNEGDVNNYQARKSGYFSDAAVTLKSGGTIAEISNIPLWPSAAAYQAAPCGDEKHIFLITDGSTTPNTRTWYTHQAVTFEKRCN
jgi:surface antigen